VLAREPGFLVVLLDLVIEGVFMGHGHGCAGQQGAGEEDTQHRGERMRCSLARVTQSTVKKLCTQRSQAGQSLGKTDFGLITLLLKIGALQGTR
jgi:hypothetical protein